MFCLQSSSLFEDSLPSFLRPIDNVVIAALFAVRADRRQVIAVLVVLPRIPVEVFVAPRIIGYITLEIRLEPSLGPETLAMNTCRVTRPGSRLALAAAFYTLALETGMRKAELCGLKWGDVDFEACTVRVVRQLVRMGKEPTFKAPKSKSGTRTIDISPEVAELLDVHRRHQAEIKMANRIVYRDNNLVFAKEWADVTKYGVVIGDPIQMNNIGQREFARLVEPAGVRPIKFHGPRHTWISFLGVGQYSRRPHIFI